MKKVPNIQACCDHQRHTCIQVDRLSDGVKFIPLDIDEGLEVLTLSTTEFDDRFKPMLNYPAVRACQLYLSYAQMIGASKEALDYLGQVINVSKEESQMATAKKAAKANRPKTATKITPAKAPAGKTAPAKKAVAVKAKAPGEKRATASAMFQELIMKGTMTDIQIFEKVQTEFGLDDKKKGYVSWYRNQLRKDGKSPPDAKVAK